MKNTIEYLSYSTPILIQYSIVQCTISVPALECALTSNPVKIEAHPSLLLQISDSRALGPDDDRDRGGGDADHCVTGLAGLSTAQQV